MLDSCAIAYELVDITEAGCEDERKYMQETAKAKEGDRNPLPPQIFNNKDYCGVSSLLTERNIHNFSNSEQN